MQRARSLGAAIETGMAREYAEGAVRFADGNAIRADALFLATGKHDLRGLARPAEARGTDPALGLRIRLEPAAARLVGATIELHLFDRGYAGLVGQEDGTVNLCLAVHRSRLAEAGDPERLMLALAAESPRLGERLAYRMAGAIDAVANVPYGWRATQGVSGLFRMGDQAGVIPSLAGEGIGIAVASGVRAARAYLAGGSAAAVRYQRDLASSLVRPLAVAGMIRSAAEHPRVARLALPLLRPALLDLLARLTRIEHSPVDAAPRPPDI
jgi:flavin-dependent dehydrogenase